MPYSPIRSCRHPRCPNKGDGSGGYCKEHSKGYNNPNAKRNQGLYSSARWKRARLMFLAEYPLCRTCKEKGETIPAEEVDHIIPHEGDPERFWDRDNWQALCTPCHSSKSRSEHSVN